METVRLEGKDYGIRIGINMVIPEMYVTKPEASRRILSLDNKSHTGIDYQLIKAWRQFPLTKQLAEFYTRGLLFFNDEYTKQVFLKYLQFIES